MTILKDHFSIEGSANRLMMADLHRPESGQSKAILIYAHGINGFKDWGGTNQIAWAFAEAGFSFLKFNFSHNGTTPDSPEDFTDPEAYGNDNYSIRQNDLKLICDFVVSDSRVGYQGQDLVLIGHSRGGTDAILYAPQDKRITKLITWAASSEAKTPWRSWDNSKLNEWKESGVQYLKNSRTNQELPVYYQLYLDHQTNKNMFDVESAARGITIPWLIVHGDEDESVFVKEAYTLKSWQPNAEVAIIPDAGHTFGRSHPWKREDLPPAAIQLIEESINFLNKFNLQHKTL